MSVFRHLIVILNLTQTFLLMPSYFLSNHNSLLILTYGLNFLRFCRLACKVFVSLLKVVSMWEIKTNKHPLCSQFPTISGFKCSFQSVGGGFLRTGVVKESLFSMQIVAFVQIFRLFCPLIALVGFHLKKTDKNPIHFPWSRKVHGVRYLLQS